MNIVSILSKELFLSPVHVQNVVDLLDDGKTVPFIARYRKELTGSMDDQTLRVLAEKLERLRSMEKRRAEILRLIDEQGALTDELRHRIEAAATMTELEDLYLPYKAKRKTRASIAAERGLSPLADALMEGLPATTRFSDIIAIRTRPLPAPNKNNAAERAELARLKQKYRIRLTEDERENGFQKGLAKMAQCLIAMAQEGENNG